LVEADYAGGERGIVFIVGDGKDDIGEGRFGGFDVFCYLYNFCQTSLSTSPHLQIGNGPTLSNSDLVPSQSFFASSIKLSFVAVNSGGAWGGVRYCLGAILEFVIGRKPLPL
jgi:hypothetical protein